MDIAALIISGLSLVVAGIGTYWSNRRSKEALAGSRRAAADARWSALQEAVQRLIGFDPSAEPIRDRLTNLRIAMLALVDELGDEWEGLDVSGSTPSGRWGQPTVGKFWSRRGPRTPLSGGWRILIPS